MTAFKIISRISVKYTALLLANLWLALLSISMPAAAQVSTDALIFETAAPYAVILDYDSGKILYEKSARDPIAPASMTKIMTAEMIFNALKSGQLSLDTEFTVSEEAWRRGGARSGSSTMFLDLKSQVSVENLIKGIIIQSGNDACIVMAEGMAGSEQAFAAQMTAKAKSMGLDSANFKNSTGWPHPDHVISMVDLAKLTRLHIQNHPEYYPLYSEKNFTWNDKTQGNRNPLLGRFTGADGVKTGRTDASGYSLVGSAIRDGVRRIIVINGLNSKSERRDVSLSLMNAAFTQFELHELVASGQKIAEAQVFMGRDDYVGLELAAPVNIGIHIAQRDKIRSRIEYKTVPAPINKGDEIAQLIIALDGREDQYYPLFATHDVKAKSIFGKAWAVIIAKIRGEL